MQNYMIIRQKVTDFAKFQQAFDQLEPERAKGGLTDLGQFCADDDADTVIVVLQVRGSLPRQGLLAFRSCQGAHRRRNCRSGRGQGRSGLAY